jgi:hypothetical protein
MKIETREVWVMLEDEISKLREIPITKKKKNQTRK